MDPPTDEPVAEADATAAGAGTADDVVSFMLGNDAFLTHVISAKIRTYYDKKGSASIVILPPLTQNQGHLFPQTWPKLMRVNIPSEEIGHLLQSAETMKTG